MAIDQDLLLCSAQAITGSAVSDNVIDTSAAASRPGTGPRPLYVDLRVTEAFTDSGNNSTADVIIQSSPYAALNSSLTNTTIGQIATNAAVGDRVIAMIPPSAVDKQYYGLYFSVAGGNFTTGKVTAWVTPDQDLRRDFTLGYTGPTTS